MDSEVTVPESMPVRLRVGGALLAASALAGAGFVLLTQRADVAPPLVMAGALALFLVAVLVRTQADAVVFLAFALLGFVKIEPAPSDILLVLMFLTLAFTEPERFENVRGPLLVHVAALAFLASNFTALNAVRDVGMAVRYTLISFYCVAFMYFVKLYVDRRSSAEVVLSGYMIAAAGSAAIGLLALAHVGVPESLVLYAGRRYGEAGQFFRLQGFFKDPNVLGPFLIPAALLAIEHVRRPWLRRLPRVVALAGAVVIVLSTVFTFSRATLLNLGIALLMYGLAVAASSSVKHLLVVTLVLAAVILPLVVVAAEVPRPFGLDVGGAVDVTVAHRGYDDERFAAQETALKSGYQRPFGIGPMQFSTYYRIGTHALYWRVLAEQGWLGIGSLLTLIGAAGVYAARSLRDKHPGIHMTLATVVLASLAGVMANGFFVDTLHWRHLWLLAGLGWVLRDGLLREEGESR